MRLIVSALDVIMGAGKKREEEPAAEWEDRNMTPKDPVMLLSFINLKLRDYYSSLEALCDDMEVSEAEIREKLGSIDYRYDEEKNQFV